MTSPDNTTQTSSHRHRSRTETDPASNRPMSLSEIKESYAEYADWIQRFDWLARLVTGRYRRKRFGDVDGKVLTSLVGRERTSDIFQRLSNSSASMLVRKC